MILPEVKIVVTQEHIDKGKPRDPRRCAFALACNDVFWFPARVTMEAVHWDCGRSSGQVYLPLEASRFIAAFDMGTPVEPTEFVLTGKRMPA